MPENAEFAVVFIAVLLSLLCAPILASRQSRNPMPVVAEGQYGIGIYDGTVVIVKKGEQFVCWFEPGEGETCEK